MNWNLLYTMNNQLLKFKKMIKYTQNKSEYTNFNGSIYGK